MKRLIVLLALCLVFVGGIVAEDQVSFDAKITEAQGALNAPGFDAAGAFGLSFSDSIDPATGALTVSQTDLSLPGRGGHGVSISRRYSSNIFLNINGMGSYPCGSENTVCDDCTFEQGVTIPQNSEYFNLIQGFTGLNPNTCPSSNGDALSFMRAKYLGRGWTMNVLENKYQDPTMLVYDPYAPSDLTYAYVSQRGVTSQSITLDNNKQPLILPTMFAPMSNAYFWWGIDLMMSTGNNAFVDASFQGTPSTDGIYTAYTKGLNPVVITNTLQGTHPVAVKPSAVYYSSSGSTYLYDHLVAFCGAYDDLTLDGTNCVQPTQAEYQDVMKWAENPYAGVYLSRGVDNFGNVVSYSYLGESPFVSTITAPGGRQASFTYDGTPLTLDTRLKSIAYDNPLGDGLLYAIYEYAVDKPLLQRTYLSLDENGGSILGGTMYTYGYNPTTQELTSVRLPSGALITYTYAWAANIPAVDAVRGNTLFPSDYGPARRVVVKKTVTNGGVCPDGSGGYTDVCSWRYSYSYNSQENLMHTTVTDPYGNDVVYKSYPATTPTLVYDAATAQ